MASLEGKTALVTGASRGIGRTIAEGLAAEGAAVAVNYPPAGGEEEAAEAVVSGIEADGGEAVALEGDVSEEASVRSMADAFESRFGAPDVVVNNAGVLSIAPLAEMSTATWDDLMAVNLRGVFLVTRSYLPGMLEAGSGKVINVASQLGFRGASGLVHYSAAKGGVIAFTRALAREVAPEITVNAIAPGPIETDMTADLGGEGRGTEGIPLDRRGTVEDVAPTAVFLAGRGGDYYTGQTLSPDGGDAMH